MFLEALEESEAGDMLVVDNDGRLDEGCIGDLVAREVQGAGLAGIVIWGRHRGSCELAEIGLPLFSLGDLEHRQALAMIDGHSLRDQLRFTDYLSRRRADDHFSFHQHLREIGGAIEE